MFPEMSEFLFSILVSYMGAVEFMFVMRHLYHWIFQHQKRLLFGDKNEESMEDLQNRIKKAIDEAAKMEKPGFTAMKDGVLYKDGFRVDPNLEQEKVAKREIIGSSKDELMCSPEEVHEEPCVKKEIKCVTESSPNNEVQPDDIIKNERTNLTQTIKTQIGQTNPQISLGQSEDSSSVEPVSSQKTSSLSNQQSSSIDTTYSMPEIHFDEYERQAPDGEDVPDQQYSEEYLRSLDGIKHRPLVREDGTGRRRAFKKRKSSDSTSSRESRASREEELKMFTSLEEEEFASMKRGDPDYVPIRYSSEPNLKVGKHHKRHKKSPMKDTSNEESKSSLEMLDEEDNNPWGEIKPEHYKNSEFWIREKAISIEEEDDDDNLNASQKKDLKGRQRLQAASPFRNIPNSSSFEDATDLQHEEAINTLKKQSSYEVEAKDNPNSENVGENKNLIFSGEYTKAMSKDWHSGHFCCWQCDESLTGQRYVIRDDHPYCIKCYENVFANTCEECNKIIGIDSKDLSYKDKHWHEACFLCNKCRISLVDKQFGAKAEKIYCGNCYDSQFASRCDGCGEIFRAGTKKMEYKTRQWHEKCFCCCVCKTPIGTKSFIPREQEIYCAGCYEEKFATRCIKCNKIITAGGVTYKNEPWHRECFTCTNCACTLAGQRFTSRDEKPYCADCFGELFAKRCTACARPITGIGGTRFISFEDRHWHHDCFICASCKTSLVGRGFITDAEDIICPECAKQKLM